MTNTHSLNDGVVLLVRWELLAQIVRWESEAAIGDNGEQPMFCITRRDGRWEVWATSFYDGGGSANGQNLEECVRKVLTEINQEPEKEKVRMFRRAVQAVASWKCISWQEAEELLRNAESDLAK